MFAEKATPGGRPCQHPDDLASLSSLALPNPVLSHTDM
jgi:hypothetical protein